MKKKIILKHNMDEWCQVDLACDREMLPANGFKAPIALIWEITGNCRSNCIYCSGGFPRRTHELSSLEKMKIADELVDMKIFAITLSGGDPMLCEELYDLVKKFTDANIPVMICTPGLSVPPEMFEPYIENPNVSFNISLDSANPVRNDYQRGKTGALKEAIGLLQLIKKRGCNKFISVETVVTHRTFDDIPSVIKLVLDYPVQEMRIQPVIAVNEKTYIKGLTLTDDELNAIDNMVMKAINEMDSDDNANDYVCIRSINQIDAIKKGLRTGVNWGGIISPEGNLSVSAYLPCYYCNISEYDGYKSAWLSGFNTAWKEIEGHKEYSDITNIAYLQQLFREKGYKKCKI